MPLSLHLFTWNKKVFLKIREFCQKTTKIVEHLNFAIWIKVLLNFVGSPWFVLSCKGCLVCLDSPRCNRSCRTSCRSSTQQMHSCDTSCTFLSWWGFGKNKLSLAFIIIMSYTREMYNVHFHSRPRYKNQNVHVLRVNYL